MSRQTSNRDAGLQPERTSLAWQRTVFSALVFTLAMVRVALWRDDRMFILLSGIAAALAIVLTILSLRRQRGLLVGGNLTTASSLMDKRLISLVLFLGSVSLALHALVNLLHKGWV
ncbi:DUF202 domain-containing protein [Yokenella regensburgei]|uniref:DUF202 domain-containing protein n=1 Tax=Yokenella regensburgei TaxID=158877 RepID=UPI003F147C36